MKEINIVKAASEMAEALLINVCLQNGKKEMSLYEKGGYTKEAQELFNIYYDDMYNYLISIGFKHVNK